MKVLFTVGNGSECKAIERRNVKQELDNIYTDNYGIYWYYPEVEKAIILGAKEKNINYSDLAKKIRLAKKDTIENYIKILDNRLAENKIILPIEIELVKSIVTRAKIRQYKQSGVEKENIKKIPKEEKIIKANITIMKALEDAKEKFAKGEYLENKIYDYYFLDTLGTIRTRKISIIAFMIDSFNIDLIPSTKGWINKKLIGCWGNKKIRCRTKSVEIFEILNKVAEKIK